MKRPGSCFAPCLGVLGFCVLSSACDGPRGPEGDSGETGPQGTQGPGTVTSVSAGPGLDGGTITDSGVLSIATEELVAEVRVHSEVGGGVAVFEFGGVASNATSEEFPLGEFEHFELEIKGGQAVWYRGGNAEHVWNNAPDFEDLLFQLANCAGGTGGVDDGWYDNVLVKG